MARATRITQLRRNIATKLKEIENHEAFAAAHRANGNPARVQFYEASIHNAREYVVRCEAKLNELLENPSA